MTRIYVTCFAFAATFTLASGAQASGPSDLIGTWGTSQPLRCSSGAPIKNSTEDVVFSQSATVVITAKDIKDIVLIAGKLDAAQGAQMQSELQAQLNQWNQKPDDAQKAKALADIQNQLGRIQKMMAGVQCSLNLVSHYSVSGNVLSTTVVSAQSDCGGGDPGISGINSNFQVTGDTLTLTDVSPVTSDSQCPVGDRLITTLQRVN